jgi:hypothetical protein
MVDAPKGIIKECVSPFIVGYEKTIDYLENI